MIVKESYLFKSLQQNLVFITIQSLHLKLHIFLSFLLITLHVAIFLSLGFCVFRIQTCAELFSLFPEQAIILNFKIKL